MLRIFYSHSFIDGRNHDDMIGFEDRDSAADGWPWP